MKIVIPEDSLLKARAELLMIEATLKRAIENSNKAKDKNKPFGVKKSSIESAFPEFCKIVKAVEERVENAEIEDGTSSHFFRFINAEQEPVQSNSVPEEKGTIIERAIAAAPKLYSSQEIENRLETLRKRGMVIYPMFGSNKMMLKGYNLNHEEGEEFKIQLRLVSGFGLNETASFFVLGKEQMEGFFTQMGYLR